MWDALEPSNAEFALRIGVAMVLAGIIGIDRELDGHPAGFRTHLAVSIGACLFGIISVDGFDRFYDERANTNFQVDVTRVASQVVVAVGFLGAGTILKGERSVRGLTTAASIWVAAAVGLAVGIGLYGAATIATAALAFALIVLKRPTEWLHRRLDTRRRSVELRLADDADVSEVVRRLHALEDVEVLSLSVSGSALRARLHPLRSGAIDAAAIELGDVPGVVELELT